jgi:CRISPR-associated endonuclease/helicase Cas3
VEKKPELLFRNYTPPEELLNTDKYFGQDVFNRYKINLIEDKSFLINDLVNHIVMQKQSCLVVLNTIADTLTLYRELSEILPKVILLNTHFIPVDRSKKIEQVKELLKKGDHVVLISTQLIEAGVDIDFPIVYRDLCPLPSLIQSAGRCNRNKKFDLGQVYFFQLQKETGRPSSEVIYNKDASNFLEFCKKEIHDGVEEKELFNLQSRYFEFIRDNLTVGEFEYGYEQQANMIECVNKAQFELMGKFNLINQNTFGEQYRYYIPENENDKFYYEAVDLLSGFEQVKNYRELKILKVRLNYMLKVLERRIVNIRISNKETLPQFSNNDEKLGIRVLSDLNKYSYEMGLELGTENQFL